MKRYFFPMHHPSQGTATILSLAAVAFVEFLAETSPLTMSQEKVLNYPMMKGRLRCNDASWATP